MNHPLKCPDCENYRHIEYDLVRFDDDNGTKGFDMDIPFYKCKSCGATESLLPEKSFLDFKDKLLPDIKEGPFVEVPLRFVFSKIDSEKRFEQFDHLQLNYDSRDYYIIPGLYRENDDGYLTPVFFDKDLLLYYNHHTDYSVKLTSFSSGNIYHMGKPMFDWGFGINRQGKIFKWLGDLNKDFDLPERKSDLKRFQASNVQSDHDIYSKFYLSQNPFSLKDAFQSSDNEVKVFRLFNDFILKINEFYNTELAKVDIDSLSEYYKSPIMEEQEQIFNSYLSLNKYLVENLQESELRRLLLSDGLTQEDLKKDGNKLGSLKLFSLFIKRILEHDNADELIAPMFVLNDLRQLHGHLNDNSFAKKYKSCKQRLGIVESSSDMEVYIALITNLIDFFTKITEEQSD